MISNLAAVLSLLTVTTFDLDLPETGAAQAPPSDLKPIVLAVVDAETGAPISSFAYIASYRSPLRAGWTDRNDWIRVDSRLGTTKLQAPISCELSVSVKAAEYIRDIRAPEPFLIRSSDKHRQLTVRLKRGVTVKGLVRDSRTGRPIAGASVAPVIGGPLVANRDKVRETITRTYGRYEVHGVDPELGVEASHPDYAYEQSNDDTRRTNAAIHHIRLVPKKRLTVKVVDREGRPLAGVTASEWDTKLATSNRRGVLAFLIRSRFEEGTFQKEGFVTQKLELEQIRPKPAEPHEFVLVTQPATRLAGAARKVENITDFPGGSPVLSGLADHAHRRRAILQVVHSCSEFRHFNAI